MESVEDTELGCVVKTEEWRDTVQEETKLGREWKNRNGSKAWSTKYKVLRDQTTESSPTSWDFLN